MLSFLKIIAKIAFFILILLNVIFFTLLYSPVALLVQLKHNDPDLIQTEVIPETFYAFVLKEGIELKTTMDIQNNRLELVNNKFLVIRRRLFMDSQEQLALDLSLLQFSSEMIGLEAGAEYYYQKPLNELSDEEWQMLLHFYLMFES